MSIERKIKRRTQRRSLRVKSSLHNPQALPRVTVFRSLSNIYVQVIDDKAHNTLVSCSSLMLKNLSGDKKSIARAIGLELAERIKKLGINAVIFDRGSYLYHGRVKSLADGIREGGVHI